MTDPQLTPEALARLRASAEEARRLGGIMRYEASVDVDARQLLALLDERDAQEKRIEDLENAVSWALGTNGEFRLRDNGEGNYWWRTELRRRAKLRWDGEREVHDAE